MVARFRQDYVGEFVVTEIKMSQGRSHQTREWIDNPIENQHISGRAAVIGSRALEKRFQHQRLQRHRGGLLAQKTLQTYGTGDIWRDMHLDFYYDTDRQEINDILQANYDQTTICYANNRTCLENPGRFYIVPYLPILDKLAMPLYLAAFDGHKEIFVIGYNDELSSGTTNWKSDVNQILHTYSDVKFWFIGSAAAIPDLWRQNANVDSMDVRKFICYCDI